MGKFWLRWKFTKGSHAILGIRYGSEAYLQYHNSLNSAHYIEHLHLTVCEAHLPLEQELIWQKWCRNPLLLCTPPSPPGRAARTRHWVHLCLAHLRQQKKPEGGGERETVNTVYSSHTQSSAFQAAGNECHFMWYSFDHVPPNREALVVVYHHHWTPDTHHCPLHRCQRLELEAVACGYTYV